ncbi:MAG: shikimate kinase [Pirellulales bacterium]|nr:shikimate kinase [Pirellulales bacterium]
MMNVVLIGLRGAGKTTVARALAARLGWQAIDLDDEIERRAGCSIAEIFARQGEPAFRDLESQCLAEWIERPEVVLATGGGVVTRSENRARLQARPRVVWLSAPAETLASRLAGDASTAARRPALTALSGVEELRQLLEQRRDWYAQCARLTLDATTAPPKELAEQILTVWNLSPGTEAP